MRKLAPAAGLAVGVLALLAVALVLQGNGNQAVAAPEVKVISTKTSTGPFAPGDVLTVTSALHNDGTPLQDLVVELEVHGPDGQVILRAPRQGVQLGANRDETVAWLWRIPKDLKSGTYTTNVTVYGTNWSPVYAQEDQGASFDVAPRG